MSQERMVRHVLLAKPWKSGPEVVQGPDGVAHVRFCLVPPWSGAKRISGIAVDREVFQDLWATSPATILSRGKASKEIIKK